MADQSKKRDRRFGPRATQTKSCEFCYKNKTRCDGNRPCSTCAGKQVQCKDRPADGSDMHFRPFVQRKRARVANAAESATAAASTETMATTATAPTAPLPIPPFSPLSDDALAQLEDNDEPEQLLFLPASPRFAASMMTVDAHAMPSENKGQPILSAPAAAPTTNPQPVVSNGEQKSALPSPLLPGQNLFVV